jgi:Lrp/AsnC family leucine-responsive transcriptional regulator
MINKNTVSLDLVDKRILYELDSNARQSNAEIGKAARVSQDVVNYRIKNLQENDVIKGYITLVDLGKLGLMQFKMYFQFQFVDDQIQKELIEFFVNHPSIVWVSRCQGRWDMIIAILVKDAREFNEIQTEILARYGKYIANKAITALIDASFCRRDYLLKNKVPAKPVYIVSKEKAQIDTTDMKIMEILTADARAPTVEIAKKLNTTARIVSYRIKQMQKNGIIKGFMLSPDLEKIGYKFFKSFISLQNATKQKKDALIQYCNQHPNIVRIVEVIGNWDMEPEFEVSDNEKFYEIIRDIRNAFPDIVKTVETVVISKEDKFVLLPENI